MKNLIRLVKINLLTFFNFDKIIESKDKNEMRKAAFKSLAIIVLLGYFSFYIYDFSKSFMDGYLALNIPYILLVQFMALVSSFIIFTNLYKVGNVLFNFKEYDLLMSLPIKKSTIILSKLMTLYFSNLIYVLLFMIPSGIVYVTNVEVGVTFYIYYIITMFIIPLVPIIVSTFIGTIITGVTSRFRHKNFANMIAMLLLVFGITYGSYAFQNKTAMDMANIGKSMVNLFNNIYPLTNTYLNIIKDSSFVSFIIFTIIPIILYILFSLLINKFYNRINSNLKSNNSNSKYKYKNSKEISPLKALYVKEFKRLLSSANYMLNTCLGAILLTVAVICMMIFGNKIDAFLGIQGLTDMFAKMTPLIMSAFCALNCTTHPSISLEGKNLWILKSIPVEPMTIYKAKILVNLSILLPTILINATLLTIYLKLSFTTYLLTLFLPTLYALFISLLGLILNIIFPNFNWKYEIRPIKQSLPAMLTVGIGMLIAVAPLSIKTNLNNTVYTLIISAIVFVLTGGLWLYLKTIGTK